MYPLHPWPSHCIQPTQIECRCLPMFLIYQPEDDQWKGPKRVVVLYVINYTYLYHHIVVLDKYTNSNLVYYSQVFTTARFRNFLVTKRVTQWILTRANVNLIVLLLLGLIFIPFSTAHSAKVSRSFCNFSVVFICDFPINYTVVSE